VIRDTRSPQTRSSRQNRKDFAPPRACTKPSALMSRAIGFEKPFNSAEEAYSTRRRTLPCRPVPRECLVGAPPNAAHGICVYPLENFGRSTSDARSIRTGFRTLHASLSAQRGLGAFRRRHASSHWPTLLRFSQLIGRIASDRPCYVLCAGANPLKGSDCSFALLYIPFTYCNTLNACSLLRSGAFRLPAQKFAPCF
jgi:hypothetical protein